MSVRVCGVLHVSAAAGRDVVSIAAQGSGHLPHTDAAKSGRSFGKVAWSSSPLFMQYSPGQLAG